MEKQNTNIASLLSESSLTIRVKNSISQKLNKLISIIEKIHNEKNTKSINIDEDSLSKEIKLTAKALVKKSDKFQKEIVESTLKQKEESMEMLEISKLRVEAQIKDLKKRENALTIKQNTSFFYNLRNNFFKIFKFNLTKKYSEKPLSMEDKLKNYNLKLSNYDHEKEQISKKFYETGSAKLALLRNQTYYALATSKVIATTESIKFIKEKIKHL